MKFLFPKIFKRYDFSRIKLGNFLDFGEGHERPMLLGIISEEDILGMMWDIRLSSYLSKKGFNNLKVKISSDESGLQMLNIYDGIPSDENLLVDLRISETRFVPSDGAQFNVHSIPFDVIRIEWLSTRNPKKKEFSPEKPQLPGQIHPSLGCLSHLLLIMYNVAKRIMKDAFLDIPDHIHLSLMYSRKMKFFDPICEGTIRAISRDLRGYNLYDIAWAGVTGSILYKKTGEVFSYVPSEQMYAISDRLVSYFNSHEYNRAVKLSMKTRFVIDRKKLEVRRKELIASNTAGII